MGLLLRERIGDPAAYLVVALWASFPASVTLQLAYTESLAMLLLVGYLYALARERWLVATVVALLVGLSRPIAVPLGLVTLVVVVLRWRARARAARSPPGRMPPCSPRSSAAVSPGCCGPRSRGGAPGCRTAYTDTMATWRGSGTVEPFTPWVGMSTYVFGDTWGPVMLVVMPLVLVAMVAGPWARNLGADLRTWTLAYPAYLAAVLDPFTSIFRYLIPLFPLLVVVLGAGWADRRGNTWGGCCGGPCRCSCSSSSASTTGPTSSGASSPRATTRRDPDGRSAGQNHAAVATTCRLSAGSSCVWACHHPPERRTMERTTSRGSPHSAPRSQASTPLRVSGTRPQRGSAGHVGRRSGQSA